MRRPVREGPAAATRLAALLRVCTPTAFVLGLALVGVAVIALLDPEPYRGLAGVPGIGLSVGVLLLTFAWRQKVSGSAVAEWGITFVLVGVGLFWAVGDYSVVRGIGQAYATEAGIPSRPNVFVYSAKSLNLTTDAVRQVTCAESDAAFRYRYDGLKLLLQSGGQYVFVPARWTRERARRSCCRAPIPSGWSSPPRGRRRAAPVRFPGRPGAAPRKAPTRMRDGDMWWYLHRRMSTSRVRAQH